MAGHLHWSRCSSVMQPCKNWRGLTCIVGLCICVGVLIQPQDFTHHAIPDWIEKELKSVPAKDKSHTLITSKQPDKSTRSHTEDNKVRPQEIISSGTYMQVFFSTAPFSVPKRKTAFSQPDIRFQEILPLWETLVGLFTFFHFGTERWLSKKHPVWCLTKVIIFVLLLQQWLFSVISFQQVSFRSLLSKRSSLLSSKCNSQSASTQSLRKRLLYVKVELLY